ncbi:MAG: OmpA family protein [Oligoflexia bacterium]|nr:OmpA family protein [Oligoflexia bacterium]
MRDMRPVILFSLWLAACAGPLPGPDKQMAEAGAGAAAGAGAGAVTGFQVGSGTGPGAFVGAGIGAVAGSIRGAIQDTQEEQQLEFAARSREVRTQAWAHDVLREQFQRRLELHPSREIYPADLFFSGDGAQLKPGAQALLREIARLNERRLPWSKLVIASYAKGADGGAWQEDVAGRRAKVVFNQFVQAGIEPRRLEARAVVVQEPLLLDPHDDPLRYNQAIEIIPVDK